MVKVSSRFIDKKIAVIGFGLEGTSAISFLLSRQAKIWVFDERNQDQFDQTIIQEFTKQGVSFYFGGIGDLDTFDLIVRSPGVPLTIPPIADAVSRKQEVTSVTKLFFEACPCPIIGVTGTKGKGTTSSLIFEMLKASGKDVYLGGNIGVPALDFLDNLNADSTVVLELSSFQLIDLDKSPHIAVLLMITSEHLDYHKDIMEYVGAKRNILSFQSDTDLAIINRDYPASRESDVYTNARVFYVSREDEIDEGSYVRDDAIYTRVSGVEGKIIKTEELKLPGSHNLENATAAVMAALLAGVPVKYIIQTLKSFNGLEHRLEYVKTVQGVRYYDDSFSTTPETVAAAIESFDDPKLLILGGSSKRSDFKQLGALINESDSIKAIIGIGEEWPTIKLNIQNQNIKYIENCKTMDEIVKTVSEIGEIGDVVILSPGCASFDMFKDYKDRGNQFKAAVKKL